ncbi:hypothetical protein [Alkalimonas amylolytica]|uniref:Replication region DNA-binding N-term n=1 Tax=Alkalimonas amylolytica TaxID=152573 RepID=A0A1H4FA87_ALKAM|nr:hypothetical protein [Alkalimonas amylolytica]SEA94233.1 hypothetical protein SAMN04488051_109116 [Alkalimonas amylolytica]
MNSTTALELLSQEAACLMQEGKTPSLALLRSRLGRRVPPADLLPAFQQWKQLPAEAKQAAVNTKIAKEPVTESQPQTDPIAHRIEQLEAKIAQLEQRLALLESQGTSHVAG